MGEAGNCYENALAERVNGILKEEFNLEETFTSFKIARKAVKEAVEKYNKIRPHWSLKFKTPDQVHYDVA
jgi:putative transposase